MSLNNINTIRNITLTGLLILILTGLAMSLLVRKVLIIITGGFCFITGFTGLLIVLNKDKFLPFKFKKFILINIILKIEMLLANMLKINAENIMQYFIFLNNRLNPDLSIKKLLLLLPRCLQQATCDRDLSMDINNCLRCGRCQIADIIKISEPGKIEVRLVGGGSLALEKIKEINPDGIIAVACERELIDGIRGTLNIPVWALKNLRPEGPCLNTKIHLNELKEILEKHS